MTKKSASTPSDPSASPSHDLPFDPMALSVSLAQAYGQIQPMMQDWLERHKDMDMGAQSAMTMFDPMNVAQAWVSFMQNLYADPARLTDMQMKYWQDWMNLWQDSARRFMGEQIAPQYQPDKGDRRFRAAAWHESALFDFIKQSYLLSSQWMRNVVHDTEGLDDETRRKIEFYTRQFVDAMAPSNFVLTNPEVLQATIDSKGENLVKGFQNLLEDFERGGGKLQISTTDYDAFKLGENIATTPGKVVYRNDLIELIQYTPATEKTFRRPLLVVPPWINKYYILDLRPDNSMIRYMVAQGHTVFVISWVNPDRKLARKSFADYMKEGILQSLETVSAITGEKDCNVMGYCLGGTLLATTLAWLKGRGKGEEKRIASATFLTTLIDFSDAGDIKVFIDDAQIESMEEEMSEKGVLEAQRLKDTFSLLRANDLIWSFVVNNYLLGREPFPFDLLYWNDDSTNMPAAMHGFYLRNMYRDNLLVRPGAVTIDDVAIDMRKIDTPAYFLSTREDHIAPWTATFSGARIFSGPVTFTLAMSGHVAGVVNPPAAGKYGYWTNPDIKDAADKWLAAGTQHDGSWWNDWSRWIAGYTGDKIPARQPGSDQFKPIADAPGAYVKARPTEKE